MARFINLKLLLLCCFSPVLSASSLPGESIEIIPLDYTAIYQVLRNDKNVAEVTIDLSHQDKLWTLHGYTHDLRGFAKALNIKASQTAVGQWRDGRFLPDDFKLSFSLIGYKTGWDASFDWSTGVVISKNKKGETNLPLTGGAIDPFSLSLNIGSFLAENKTQMTVNVLDEDEIDTHVYQTELVEAFNSNLGCLHTTQVNRIRKNTKRRSQVWYANDYNYIPVLMHHSKKNGTKLELQILSLSLDGEKIMPGDSCMKNEFETLSDRN